MEEEAKNHKEGISVEIQVRLFASFREGRQNTLDLDLPFETTVGDVIDQLGIKEEEVAILLVNGIDGKVSQTLNQNDVVSLFPPTGGG